jgi:hypothetical protein
MASERRRAGQRTILLIDEIHRWSKSQQDALLPHVEDGSIMIGRGSDMSGITWTKDVPKQNYEVELEARRTQGIDFFCGLTFPVKDSFATLVVGGWGGAVVGISSLDGEDAAHNSTTRYHRFKNGQWYRIRLAVTATNLSVWLDGDQVVDADIRGKNVALRAGEIEASKPFGIASYSTTAELRGIQLRRLGPAQEAPAKAVALPATLVASLDRLVAAATNSDFAHRRLAEMCGLHVFENPRVKQKDGFVLIHDGEIARWLPKYRAPEVG